jgi:hypothetical protein
LPVFGAESFVFQFAIQSIQIKIYRVIILPVVLFVCGTCSLTLREERRLRVFENRVLRRIFAPNRDELTGEWRKLHNEELYDLKSSPIIVWVFKPRRMRRVGHVARMGDRRGEYRVLVGKSKRKRPLRRPRLRWEDNIKMDRQEVRWVGMEWIDLAQNRDRQVAGNCKCGDEPSGSIQCGEFLNYLRIMEYVSNFDAWGR